MLVAEANSGYAPQLAAAPLLIESTLSAALPGAEGVLSIRGWLRTRPRHRVAQSMAVASRRRSRRVMTGVASAPCVKTDTMIVKATVDQSHRSSGKVT